MSRSTRSRGRIRKDGSVAIPRVALDQVGLREGAEVEIEANGSMIAIRPADVISPPVQAGVAPDLHDWRLPAEQIERLRADARHVREATNGLPPLTPEQRAARVQSALANSRRRHAELLAAHGGRPFTPAGLLIDEMRVELEHDIE